MSPTSKRPPTPSRVRLGVDLPSPPSSFLLPVEIHDMDLAPVPGGERLLSLRHKTGAGLFSDEIELAPGSYFVKARLPAGLEFSGTLKVKSGPNPDVVLRPNVEVALTPRGNAVEVLRGRTTLRTFPTDRFWEVLASGVFGAVLPRWDSAGPSFFSAIGRPPVGPVVERLGPGLEGAGPQAVPAAWFAGNPLSEPADLVRLGDNSGPGPNTLPDLLEPDTTHTVGNDTGRPIYLRFQPPGGEPTVAAIPAGPREPCRVTLPRPDWGGGALLDVGLGNERADLLARYLARDVLAPARLVADTGDWAEQLLESKEKGEVGAAVGAYALLRFGQVERLQEWTKNLRAWFTWLPDGLSIRGEHLARQGRHAEALDAFLGLAGRGLPLFTDGLSYAVDRLRLYSGVAAGSFPAGKASEAARLLGRLQPYATHADVRQPVLMFAGEDPARPGRAAVPGADVRVSKARPNPARDQPEAPDRRPRPDRGALTMSTERLTESATPAVEGLMAEGNDPDWLYAQLGLRLQEITRQPSRSGDFALEPTVEPAGPILDAARDFGRRYYNRVSRAAYTLVCGADPDSAADRKKIEAALHVGPVAAAAALAAALVAHLAIAPAVAAVVAAIVIKLFFNTAVATVCEVWGEHLPPAKP